MSVLPHTPHHTTPHGHQYQHPAAGPVLIRHFPFSFPAPSGPHLLLRTCGHSRPQIPGESPAALVERRVRFILSTPVQSAQSGKQSEGDTSKQILGTSSRHGCVSDARGDHGQTAKKEAGLYLLECRWTREGLDERDGLLPIRLDRHFALTQSPQSLNRSRSHSLPYCLPSSLLLLLSGPPPSPPSAGGALQTNQSPPCLPTYLPTFLPIPFSPSRRFSPTFEKHRQIFRRSVIPAIHLDLDL